MSDSIWFCCPFHGESTASCKVNTVSDSKSVFGWYYCFGCRATGPWNKLALKMGLQKFDPSDVNAIDGFTPKLGSKFNKIKNSLLGSNQSDEDWAQFDELIERNRLFDISIDWREIKKDTLVKMGCRRLIDKRNGDSYLIIPVSVNGVVQGLVRARWIPEEGKLNYINSSVGVTSRWASRGGLLGFDYAISLPAFKKYRIIFIVEGPRDAMRLLELGIPAVSIIGSKNWSKAKKELLLTCEPDLVCSLFDNDDAGRQAGRQVR